jgi:hypothetical protein
MSTRYELRAATYGDGVRVAEIATGETVVFAGRTLDALSYPAAQEIVALLERSHRLRVQWERHIESGTDLVAVFDHRRQQENVKRLWR